MRATLLLSAFLTLWCFAHCSPDGHLPFRNFVKLDDFKVTGRIVNGTKAVHRQFPHQVSLRRRWFRTHFCGGSIISTRLVLTAAHCMYLNGLSIWSSTVVVVAGQLKLNELEASTQERAVVKSILHPKFDITTLQNDIAVLELAAPFEYIPEVRNAPLATFHPVPNTVCQVSGWGYPAQDVREVTNDLMYVDLPIRSIEECREMLINETNMPPGMFCAGYLEGGRDACQGDSGGGMVCNGVLVGVVSGGSGCALPRLPGVYSNVYHYKDWITKGIIYTENVNLLK